MVLVTILVKKAKYLVEEQTVKTQIRLLLRSSLILVCTVTLGLSCSMFTILEPLPELLLVEIVLKNLFFFIYIYTRQESHIHIIECDFVIVPCYHGNICTMETF